MKKVMSVVTVILILLVLAVGASANTATRLRVNIPFAFHVGTDTLPAGEYIFEMRSINAYAPSTSLVVVWDQKGYVVALTPSMPGLDQSPDVAPIHFNRYSSDYFLSAVIGSGYQATVKATKLEKELRAKGPGAADTILVEQK